MDMEMLQLCKIIYCIILLLDRNISFVIRKHVLECQLTTKICHF